jgi:hypothetical protein
MAVGSLGGVVANILRTQAETNRALADKLPNVTGLAKAALLENANEFGMTPQVRHFIIEALRVR